MDSETAAVVVALVIMALSLLVLGGLFGFEWHMRRQGNSGWDYPGVTPTQRAEALLREILDEREYEQWTKRDYVDVVSPCSARRIYRIPRYIGLVRMYENGIATRELCLRSVEPLPGPDVVVMHKLMIQGDEQEYLASARSYPLSGVELRYHP